jgi:hypothetical protein
MKFRQTFICGRPSSHEAVARLIHRLAVRLGAEIEYRDVRVSVRARIRRERPQSQGSAGGQPNPKPGIAGALEWWWLSNSGGF